MKYTGKLLAITAIMTATLFMSSCKKDKMKEPIDENLKDYNELYQSFKKEQVSEIVKVTDESGKNSLTMEIFAKDAGTLKQYLRAHDFVLNTNSDVINTEKAMIDLNENISESVEGKEFEITVFYLSADFKDNIGTYNVEFINTKSLRAIYATTIIGHAWWHYARVCFNNPNGSSSVWVQWYTQHRWYSGWSYRGSHYFFSTSCNEYYHGMYRIKAVVYNQQYAGTSFSVWGKKWSGNSWTQYF